MNVTFRTELHMPVGVMDSDTVLDHSCLEISRDAHNTIIFTIISGANKVILTGQCEPDELYRLATILAGDPD